MSETKFTKGPWSTVPGSLEVFDSDRQSIADVADRWKGTTTDQGSANAQLMAAAPDLYGALERTLDRLDKVLQSKAVRDISETIGEAQFALKKARGEQ